VNPFEYVRHPHIDARKEIGPTKVDDQRPRGSRITRFNATLAVWITKVVGSMWCAYAFAAFDLISLPAAIHGGTATIVSWIAQTFLQLVLLSVIIVGQNVQAAAADKRAEATYLDAEAVLHEATQIQAHLAAQDAEISKLAGVQAMVADLHARHAGARPLSDGRPS
jgi:hypothetical protein